MPELPFDAPKILALYLQISQYPILARHIRQRMRDELYRRGVITPQHLEQEAKDKAVLSQHREGLTDPFGEEDAHAWEERLQQIRDHLTDFYFAYNLPMDLFHRIVEELVAERSLRRDESGTAREVRLSFNPELAPIDLLMRQAAQYEGMLGDDRAAIQHHLEEIIVVLIRTMISDQLSFVRVAKAWFSAEDFEFIQSRRIGSGKIGGKAAGMLLAWKLLQRAAPDLAEQVCIPESYFVGADVFYDFKAYNGLAHNQKYKPPDQIRAEYPGIQEMYERGRFPDDVADHLRDVLEAVGPTPLVVRSSSLLEDSFGTSFAGKYASYFCPNQGTLKENLRELTLAIRRIYGSVYSPDALIYRRRMGLLDYDERMAIMVQEVQGEAYRQYYFPTLAGVAFSQSPIVWSPRLRREEGFVRMVLGLGTRAVERVGEDYPRLVFLSHPLLRPENTPEAMEHYSQHLVDAIDLADNTFATLPVREVLERDYENLRWVASVRDTETLRPLRHISPQYSPAQAVLTFENLLQRSGFVPLVRNVLATLARHYGLPVDVEFAVTLPQAGSASTLKFHLLQCRPQSTHGFGGEVIRPFPLDVPPGDKLFSTTRMVPRGDVGRVEYVVYVEPQGYQQLTEPAQRKEVAAWVGRVNKALEGRNFILIGPGRWGTSNLQLGVPVGYADIYNARILVELAVGPKGSAPEPSYGTHFFQDLVEARIYSLAIHADGDGDGDSVNWDFIAKAKNAAPALFPGEGPVPDCLKLIHVPAERPEQYLEIIMDGAKALAFFARPSA